MINVLDCVKLVQNPTLYASFLLWMLSELFESLPEAGDLDKPKLLLSFLPSAIRRSLFSCGVRTCAWASPQQAFPLQRSLPLQAQPFPLP